MVSSVQLSAPFREHESSHRLLRAGCVPVCFWSSSFHSGAFVFSLIIVKAALVQGTKRPQLHLAAACLLEPPAAVMFHNQIKASLLPTI
jgi:hypothetical protein